jgi:alpha-2-macroglobulin
MKIQLLIALALICTLSLKSQSELQWKLGYYSPDLVSEKLKTETRSNVILVFRLKSDDAEKILQDKKAALEYYKNNPPSQTFQKIEFKKSNLTFGNYLFVELIENKVFIEYYVKSPLSLFTWEFDKNNIGLIVMDSSNIQIKDVRVIDEKGKTLSIDPTGHLIKIPKKGYSSYTIATKGYVFYYISKKDLRYDYWTERKKNYGFLVLDKPKYKPGDTVHFKAFVYNKRQKPLKKELVFELNEYYRRNWSNSTTGRKISVKPSNAGAYIGSFILDDSLQIDQNYQISSKGKVYYTVENHFKLEDYRLDDYYVSIETDIEKIYQNDDLTLSISTLDFNQHLIKGGHYQVVIESGDFEFAAEESFYIPKILYRTEGNLLSESPTTITIKSEYIPKQNGRIEAKIKVWNASDVQQTKELSFPIINLPNLQFTPVKDSIRYEIPESEIGKIRINFSDKSLILNDSKGTFSIDFSKNIPTYSVLNYDYSQKIKFKVNISPQLISNRIGDSVFISVYNPYGLRSKISAFSGKKLLFVLEGMIGDTLIYHPSNQNISFIFEYYYDGDYRNNHTELLTLERYLNIETSLPEKVEPGTKHQIKIKVTDVNGNPVPEVNLTAWAINREFNNYDNTQAYGYAESQQDKNGNYYYFASNKVKLIDKYNPTLSKVFQINDQNLYYKMLYPKKGLEAVYHPTGGNYAHFAPYIADNGNFKSIYYFFIDGHPVYYKYAYTGPWSFIWTDGYHQIVLRTETNIYVIDSVLFKAGEKLELSIDAQNPASNIKIIKANKKLSKSEQRLIVAYLCNFSGGSTNLVKQDSRVFKLNNTIVFPIEKNSFYYYDADGKTSGRLNNSTTRVIKSENVFEYYEKPIKLSARQDRNPYKGRHWFSSYSGYRNVGEYSLKIDEYYEKPLNTPPDLPFKTPSSDSCFVKINLLNDSISTNHIYLISNDSNDYFFLKINPATHNGRSASYSSTRPATINPGSYTLVAYTKTNNLVIYRIDAKDGGTNYFSLGENYINYIPLDNYKKSRQDSVINAIFLKDRIIAHEENGYYGYSFVNRPLYYDTIQFVLLKPLLFNSKRSSNENYYQRRSGFNEPNSITVFKNSYLSGLLFFEYDSEGTPLLFDNIPAQYDFIKLSTEPILRLEYITKTTKDQHNTAYYNDNYNFEESYLERISGKSMSKRRSQPLRRMPKHNSVLFLWDSDRSDRSLKSEEVMVGGVPFLNGYIENSSTDFAFSLNCPSFGSGEDGNVLEYGMQDIAYNLPLIEQFAGGLPAMFGDIVMDSILNMIGISNNIRDDFSDVGFWVPNLITDENGEATCEVEFPDNITGWKVTVFAAGTKGEQGRFDKNVMAMKSLVSKLEVPRFLIEGDSSAVHANVLNYSDSIHVINEYFKVGNAVIHLNQLTIDSFAKNDFHIQGKDSTVYAEYGFIGTKGEADAEGRSIPVFPKGSRFAEGSFQKLLSDSTFIVQAFDNDVKVVFYQGILDVLLNDIEEVKAYKYDCNEQLASKLMVLLLQEKVYSQLGKKFKDKREIIKIIKQLENNRKSSFGWGWWKNSEEVQWISNHVATALINARLSGYKVNYMTKNEDVFMYYKKYQNSNLDFLFAKLGLFSNPLSFDEKKKNLSVEDQLWNFKTKHLLKIPFTVEDVLILSNINMDGSVYFGKNSFARDENQILCTSLAFEIIYAKDSLHPVLEKMEQFLLNRHGYEKLNTYEIAYMAQALLPYYLQKHDAFAPAKITNQDGSEQSFNQVFTIPKGETMSFKIKEGSDIYAANWTEYFDPEPQKVDSLFLIETKFFKDTKEVTQFAEGEKIEMNVTIKSKRQADFVMIEIPLLAASYYLNNDDQRNPYEVHREYYKDRLIIYCSQLPEGTQTFSFSLQAIFNGQFTLNPTIAKEMYYPFFYGRNEIRKVNVGKR